MFKMGAVAEYAQWIGYRLSAVIDRKCKVDKEYNKGMAELNALILEIFFFFQAEDGIRDLTVTGVQTCALPIFEPGVEANMHAPDRTIPVHCLPAGYPLGGANTPARKRLSNSLLDRMACLGGAEIGRASCRERV